MGNIKLSLSLFAVLGFFSTAAQVDANFSMVRFYVPGQNPYVETFLHVNPHSVTYTETDEGLYQGKLEVTYAFIDSLDNVAAFEKFEILSPPVENPDSSRESFMDRQVIPVENGTYRLEISLTDVYGSDRKTVTGQQNITLNFTDDTASISDIEFVARKSKQPDPDGMWTKNGVELIPYIYDFIPDHMKKLTFYTELYNTDKAVGSSPFIAKYGITNEGGEYISHLTSFKRFAGNRVHILMSAFNIEDLPSGNYFLSIQLLDSNQRVFASQSLNFLQINRSVAQPGQAVTTYQRFADYVENMGFDTLSEYVKSMNPVADGSDQSFINADHNMLPEGQLQNFFVEFWLKKNPKDPAEAWFAYKKKVDEVNNTFGTRQFPGYETDRGFIYLKYGEPNTIVRRDNEPSNYPYHIWHYYDHPRRSDARYIFFNPEISTNEYRLLHSNVIGEINNPRWKQQLSRRNTPFKDVDFEGESGNWGDWADEFFTRPR